MKILLWFCAAYWLVMFVAFLFGYQPEPFTIGCALLLSTLNFVNMAINQSK